MISVKQFWQFEIHITIITINMKSTRSENKSKFQDLKHYLQLFSFYIYVLITYLLFNLSNMYWIYIILNFLIQDFRIYINCTTLKCAFICSKIVNRVIFKWQLQKCCILSGSQLNSASNWIKSTKQNPKFELQILLKDCKWKFIKSKICKG